MSQPELKLKPIEIYGNLEILGRVPLTNKLMTTLKQQKIDDWAVDA